MYSKEAIDKKNADLRTDYESQNETVGGFVFEKKDKDSRSAENLVVFGGDVTS